jgi:hypothetical protein
MYRVRFLVVLCLFAGGVMPSASHAQQSSSATSATAGSTTAANAVPASERVVIKVGDVNITQAQFDAMYAAFQKENEGGPVQKAKTLAENYAGSLMLSQQALAQHLDTTPDVQRQLEMNRIQILSNAEYDRLKDQAKPTMQETAAYYNAHLSDFDNVSIRRVFIFKQTSTSSGRGLPSAEAKTRAEEIHKVLVSGGDANALIKDTRDAVDTEPLVFYRDGLPAGMSQAFDMKVGEWSQIADTPETLAMFVVVKKDRMTLAQATPEIERKMSAQKLREEMDALKKKTGVWMDEQYFSGPVSAANGPAADPSNKKEAREKD